MSDGAVNRATEACKEILSPLEPAQRGVVLADLFALLLAGHVLPGHPTETDQMREELLQNHVEAIRALTMINAKMLGIAE